MPKTLSHIVILIDENVSQRRVLAERSRILSLDGHEISLESGNGLDAYKSHVGSHSVSQGDTLPFNANYVGCPPNPNVDPSYEFQWLKAVVLLTLFKEATVYDAATTEGDYDFSRVKWTFKFFDSARRVDYKDGRAFMPFDNESFTQFENQVKQRLINPPEPAPDTLSYEPGVGIKCLSDTLKAVTGSLPWPEPENQSLDTSRNLGDDEITYRNYVYAFMKVPASEKELLEFSGLAPNCNTKEFMSVLLPQAFSHQFHYKLRIRLSFYDLWTTPHLAPLRDPVITKNPTPYPKQIIKCLQYLGGGKIYPTPNLDFVEDQSKLFGIIPYYVFLRLTLRKSQSLENASIPSHIIHLATKAGKPKISPECGGEAPSSSVVGRKVPSSVLDTSTHTLSKSGRSYQRLSSGYEATEEESFAHHCKRLQAIQAQDKLREADRKRKREYDDFYRIDYEDQHGLIDDTYDSGFNLDTNSQCGKEQRLESWINEGNFNTKKKKHIEIPSTTHSRPVALPKPHVFHEPAPKVVPSRGRKMLATVERKNQKVTANELKRRSNEGFDIKRIAHLQERELSSIKRKLRLHLEGELEVADENAIAWLDNYKKHLRLFSAQIIDTDDEPCLVALAQALVNDAAIKYNRQRLHNLKAACKRNRLSVKQLLEDILLIDFPTLNKKIINAHECSGSLSEDDKEWMKILAFRETELQIILRLEIAWYFVEPSEDETESLTTDVVRLLQIIAAYRMNPPIDYFINTVLLPTYHQIGKFMRGVYRRMNLPLPNQLMDGSPIAGSSRRDDDSSMISSTSSANLCPEDSASQLNIRHHYQQKPKRPRQSPSAHRSFGHYSGSGRKPNSGSKRIKRQIYVSNPKLPSTSNYGMDKTDSQKKVAASSKASPKRVRRNLFDVQKKDKKDSKTLLALSCPSRSTRSPVFKSPKGKSPMSGSGFFRACRSRRKLEMTNDPSNESPVQDPEVLCPESPAATTPSGTGKYSMCSKYTGSVERRPYLGIVQESPEIKNEYDNRQVMKVASLSFYSSANVSKSRIWENSETQLMAARIKDSVDLRSREDSGLPGLSLNDLEIISKSPQFKTEPEPSPQQNVSNSTGTTTSLSFCADSVAANEPAGLMSPPCYQLITGPAPGLNNPVVEALILRDNFSAIPLTSMRQDDNSLDLSLHDVTSPTASSSNTVAGPSSSPAVNLETPSKRVQFNLKENLVNTPSRRTSFGTPKSILKETQE